VRDPVVSVTNLSRRFGSKLALQDVTLAVSRGCVFGLVGENGAGKSTLIKHLLGLWRAETVGVKVFGLDPVAEPTAVLGRIMLLALSAVPIGRLGLAPSRLARNRHR
jgi:ABC-2 type transport system ATP-binding protein